MAKASDEAPAHAFDDFCFPTGKFVLLDRVSPTTLELCTDPFWTLGVATGNMGLLETLWDSLRLFESVSVFSASDIRVTRPRSVPWRRVLEDTVRSCALRGNPRTARQGTTRDGVPSSLPSVSPPWRVSDRLVVRLAWRTFL